MGDGTGRLCTRWPISSRIHRRAEEPKIRTRREGGAAMVEFALVLPIFLALVFGVISYGYMLSYRQTISQAVAEGTRVMAVAPPEMLATTRLTKANAAINGALGSYGISCSGTALKRGSTTIGSCDVTASIVCPEDSAVMCAKVTITHLYRDHPLIPSFPGLGFSLPHELTYTSYVEVSS